MNVRECLPSPKIVMVSLLRTCRVKTPTTLWKRSPMFWCGPYRCPARKMVYSSPNIRAAALRSSSKAYLEMPYGSFGRGSANSWNGGAASPYTALADRYTKLFTWPVMAAFSSATDLLRFVLYVKVRVKCDRTSEANSDVW